MLLIGHDNKKVNVMKRKVSVKPDKKGMEGDVNYFMYMKKRSVGNAMLQ